MSLPLPFPLSPLLRAPDTATLTVKVTPKKAGTKKKPKNATYTLDVVNDNTKRTMSDLDVFLAEERQAEPQGHAVVRSRHDLARELPEERRARHR